MMWPKPDAAEARLAEIYGEPVERVSRAGRVIRTAVLVLVLVLTLLGSVFGQDDHFPFGPFRMYSTTDDPNRPVVEILIFATDNGGRRFELNENNSGVRRAEVEGQLTKFLTDRSLQANMAQAWNDRNPKNPVVRVDIVSRSHELRSGDATGRFTDTELASWTK